MPLPEYTGTLSLKQAAHLLRRAAFGGSVTQINDFVGITPATAIGRLFPATLPDPAEPIDPLTGQAWGTIPPAGDEDGDYQEYFKRWFIAQMMSAGIEPTTAQPYLPLAYAAREKIVLFLHTHFTAIQSKISNSRSLYFQNKLFRLFARDSLSTLPIANIKELTVKVSVDNAMLRLLDGDLNVKGSPNENYARELLELYTIGRGLEGSLPPTSGQGDYYVYTEEDVQAAARVLSGWEVDEDFTTLDIDTQIPRGRVRGGTNNASAHDDEPKQFSARMGNAVIQTSARTEEGALTEIRQLIDLIYSNQETAKNICWKIYRFFGYATHTKEAAEDVDTNIILPMVATLEANNYQILPVIQELLKSQHFYDAATATDLVDDNFGGIIKSPIDLVLSTYNFFEVKLPDMVAETDAFYALTERIVNTLSNQGMKFYEPYDVAGYDAYHQFPIYHRAWITPNYLARRYEFVSSVIMFDPSDPDPDPLSVDTVQFVRDNFASVASDSEQLVIEVAKYIFPVSDGLTFSASTNSALTQLRLNYFKQRFLQDLRGGSLTAEQYWTQRWGTNGNGAIDLDYQLEFLFNSMMQTPEYQLA